MVGRSLCTSRAWKYPHLYHSGPETRMGIQGSGCPSTFYEYLPVKGHYLHRGPALHIKHIVQVVVHLFEKTGVLTWTLV